MLDEQQIIRILHTSIKCMQDIKEGKEGRNIKIFQLIGAIQATFGTLEVFTDNEELKQCFKTLNDILSL